MPLGQGLVGDVLELLGVPGLDLLGLVFELCGQALFGALEHIPHRRLSDAQVVGDHLLRPPLHAQLPRLSFTVTSDLFRWTSRHL